MFEMGKGSPKDRRPGGANVLSSQIEDTVDMLGGVGNGRTWPQSTVWQATGSVLKYMSFKEYFKYIC